VPYHRLCSMLLALYCGIVASVSALNLQVAMPALTEEFVDSC
jgi:hypothetical protein